MGHDRHVYLLWKDGIYTHLEDWWSQAFGFHSQEISSGCTEKSLKNVARRTALRHWFRFLLGLWTNELLMTRYGEHMTLGSRGDFSRGNSDSRDDRWTRVAFSTTLQLITAAANHSNYLYLHEQILRGRSESPENYVKKFDHTRRSETNLSISGALIYWDQLIVPASTSKVRKSKPSA